MENKFDDTERVNVANYNRNWCVKFHDISAVYIRDIYFFVGQMYDKSCL